ncbi:MAG: hypothetical protein M5U28_36320 [Sandaracinaceae bacterium]|nr:hypothetical protein [Sandaracinaceae bacterium]
MQLEPQNASEVIELLSTPALVNDRYLVLAWQERDGTSFLRLRHRVGVIDLETRAVSAEFPLLTLSASVPAYAGGGTVEMESRWQLQRGTILPVSQTGMELGLAYVPMGNGPSEQPFHGWVFELDLDAWRSSGAGAAIASVMTTTAETDCGPAGNRETRVCGGGVWNAAGILLDQPAAGGPFELYVPTGNGRQDLDRGAYAHSVLRMSRGLAFDPGCDPTLCADFDELDPDPACQSTCTDLSMARLMPGRRRCRRRTACATVVRSWTAWARWTGTWGRTRRCWRRWREALGCWCSPARTAGSTCSTRRRWGGSTIGCRRASSAGRRTTPAARGGRGCS